jgi:hypothetical protein
MMRTATALLLLATLVSSADAHADDAKAVVEASTTQKIRRVGASEVAAAIRDELAKRPMPKNASIVAIRAAAVEVGADFERVHVDLPALPRRPGRITVQAKVTLVGGDDATLFRTLVPIDLELPPSAAFPDIPRGAAIALVVKRGLLEVSVPAVAAIDADVGTILPVTLRPSGRVVRARAVDKDHAVAVEGS